MENAELIKALKEDAEWAHGNEWETPITLGDHLDAAAAALEAADRRIAELEAAQRWIPVSEKLPEQDGSYLVIDESENVFNSTFDGICGDNGEFGEWSAIYDQHTLGYLESEWNSYSGITHWQHLPQPPEKGE